MFVMFTFEFAILALVFAIFALGMIFALVVVFALTKMLDLVVVLLHFALFDSQQIHNSILLATSRRADLGSLMSTYRHLMNYNAAVNPGTVWLHMIC